MIITKGFSKIYILANLNYDKHNELFSIDLWVGGRKSKEQCSRLSGKPPRSSSTPWSSSLDADCWRSAWRPARGRARRRSRPTPRRRRSRGRSDMFATFSSLISSRQQGDIKSFSITFVSKAYLRAQHWFKTLQFHLKINKCWPSDTIAA